MKAPLRIAVAQPITRLRDLAGNVAAHASTVVAAAARLVVFPELSLTGYGYDAPVVDPRSPALLPLVDACGEAGTTALVGAPIRVGSGESSARGIGVLEIDGEGVRPAYVKMHLGRKEATRFVPGRVPSTLSIDGWRVGIGVCTDTKDSSHLAQTAALGIDLYVAGHVRAPHEASKVTSRAARIRDRYAVPVAFAGFAGETGGGYSTTLGGSAIWDVSGRLLASCGSHPGDIAVAVLD